MKTDIELSLKKQIQSIAKERHITPAEVWQNVFLERFLARLCHSPHRPHFILKGGVLLARHVDIGRETKDLDFTVQSLSNDVGTLQKVMEEIVAIDLKDGFEFKNIRVESLSNFAAEYPDTQIRIDACFGKGRFTLFIDLGYGDEVKVKEEDLSLLADAKGPLFEKTVNLKCYPMEFVFAEKLETIVYRGAENSRMKDFHDLYSLIQDEKALHVDEAKTAVEAVFRHRGTQLKIPVAFDEGSIKQLQHSWQRYRSSVMFPKRLPENITDIVDSINNVLIYTEKHPKTKF